MLVKNVDFAVEFLGSLLKSLADAVTEKVAGRNQVRDQGGGGQVYPAHVLDIGLAKFEDAPDDCGLAFPYNYWRDLVEDGFDESVLLEVDMDEIIVMMTAMRTDLA